MSKYIVVDTDELVNKLIHNVIKSDIKDIVEHSDYEFAKKWAEAQVNELDKHIPIKRSLFPNNIAQYIGYNPDIEPWCHCNASCAFCYVNNLNCKVHDRPRS